MSESYCSKGLYAVKHQIHNEDLDLSCTPHCMHNVRITLLYPFLDNKAHCDIIVFFRVFKKARMFYVESAFSSILSRLKQIHENKVFLYTFKQKTKHII